MVLDLQFEEIGGRMYISDKPIEKATEDTLDRSNFSKNLAKALNDFKNNDTFTIGLFGEWGSGKTSIVNMSLNELAELQKGEENKIIVLKFEPWHFTNSTQLFNQFLIGLANEFVSKKDKGLKVVGKALCQYSSAFELAELIPVPFLGKAVAKFGKASVEHVGKQLQGNLESKDILKQKDAVIKLLRKANQKILIVIDDIDRLDNEQIRQVFQLVSAVAKFPNTIYLLVFDKNIVVKALEKVQEGDGEEYLKKVIQIPIQIPEVKTYKLFNTLFDRLNKIVESNPQVKYNEEHWHFIFKYCVEPFIKNLRDVSRLSNALEFKITNIAEEVDFADLIGISVLEIREPKIYEWIKTNKNQLVGSNNGWSARGKKEEEQFNAIREEINSIIARGGFSDTIAIEKRVQNAIVAVSCLFPAFGNMIGRNYVSVSLADRRKYNLISHEDKFDRYFNLDIDEVVVKQFMVDKVLRELNVTEIKDLLLELEEKGKAYELLEEIEVVLQDMNEDRVLVILEGILEATYYFESSRARGIMWVSAQSKAEHLIYKMLQRLNALKVGEQLVVLIKKASCFNMEILARIINMIELGYGRLAANGKERTEYGKIVSIESLEKIEKEYAVQCRNIFERISLFEMRSWRMAYHLWRSFDGEYVISYLNKKFKEDKNVVIYLNELVGEWSGSSITYEVQKEDEYISSWRISEAIENLVNNKELFLLPKAIQRRAAAYYLFINNLKQDYEEHVSQKNADEWLEEKNK